MLAPLEGRLARDPIAPQRKDRARNEMLLECYVFCASVHAMTIGLIDEHLTGSAIGAFFSVYDTLGHGFLEHIYKAALERELRARGHDVAREVGVTVFYKGEELAHQRLDMLVDDRLVIEVKSKQEPPEIGRAQLLNYLRATNLEVGLLLNFGPKPSFKRVLCENARHHKPLPDSREPDARTE